MSTPSGMSKQLNEHLDASEGSVILEVERGRHWIVVDEKTPNGNYIVRDPRNTVAREVTAQDLVNNGPTNTGVVLLKAS